MKGTRGGGRVFFLFMFLYSRAWCLRGEENASLFGFCFFGAERDGTPGGGAGVMICNITGVLH